MKNMERAQERWKSRTQAAATDGTYKEGIESVTESPGAAANRNIDGYRAGVQAAIDSGRVQSGNSSYTLQEWKDQAVSKGASALSAAAGKVSPRKRAKQIQAMKDSAEIGASIKSSMPGATPEQRKARMLAYFEQRMARPVTGRS